MKPPAGDRWRPAWGWVLAAAALLAAALWVWVWVKAPGATVAEPAAPPMLQLPPPPTAVPAPAASPSAVAAAVPTSAPVLRPPPAPRADDDLAAHVPAGTEPTMNEVIERLHRAGVRTGLGAFNAPGTRPPLIGLAVPEDFVLPPGYLRHHQATDDGQRIEAILMFDPDQPPPAAAGRLLDTPTARVVAAELAPPGLPIRLITLPTPAEPGGTRR